MKGILDRYWSRKKSGNNKKFAYLGDRVSAVGGCEVAAIARRKC